MHYIKLVISPPHPFLPISSPFLPPHLISLVLYIIAAMWEKNGRLSPDPIDLAELLIIRAGGGLYQKLL